MAALFPHAAHADVPVSAEDAALAEALAAAEAEVIEVTGRAPTPTQPIEVLDRDAIRRTNAMTAADALGRVAGIQTEGPHNARDRAAQVRIRGLDPRYTLALVDGERVPARDVRGVVDFSSVPASAIERIEIVKGPLAVLFGGDAIAGAINIVTHAKIEGTKVEAAAGYGSFDTRTATARFATGKNGRSVQLAVNHEDSNGWSDAWDLDRTLRQTTTKLDARGTTKTTVTSTESLRRGSDELRATQRVFVGTALKRKQVTKYVEQGTIEGEEDSIDAAGSVAWTRRDDNGGRWIASAQLARHATDKGEIRDVVLRQNGRDTGSLWTDERDDITHWLGSARLQRRLVRGKHELTAMTEWRSELRDVDNHNVRITRDPEGLKTGDADFRDPTRIYRVHEGVGSLVAQDDWNAGGRVSTVLGVRGDYHQTWGARICPAGAVAAKIDPQLTVRYAVGLGYKAPSIESRNRSPVPDLDVNGNAWVAGNPDLRPESSLGQELSAIFIPDPEGRDTRQLVVQASVFRNDFRDKIETETTDDYMASGLPLTREINLGRAVTQGVEASAGYEVARALWLGANYTFVGTRNLDLSTRLDKTVTHTINLLGSYTYRPTRTTLRATTRWLDRAVRVAADGTSRPNIPAVVTTDVRLEQGVTKQLSLTVQAENVFGATWDRDDDGDTDLPPASVFVGLWAHL